VTITCLSLERWSWLSAVYSSLADNTTCNIGDAAWIHFPHSEEKQLIQ
jgi:hypothetical protein